MHSNEALITKLYEGFQRRDYKAMQSCYANDATFNDPVFSNLNAAEVKAMWEMFCVNGKNLQIEFENVKANDSNGSAYWIARYNFSASGKKVTNRIHASFEFRNNAIVKHNDDFNFYKWTVQAFGLGGILLATIPILKNRMKQTALRNLHKYMAKSLREA